MEQTYWASCAGGLQFCLRAELEALDGTQILPDDISRGVLFRTTLEPEQLVKLRSADNIFAFLAHSKDVPLEKEPGMKYLSSLASKCAWNPAIALHGGWQNLHNTRKASTRVSSSVCECPKEADIAPSKQVTFRVTGHRISLKMKKQGYTSMDAAAVIGESVHVLQGWKANMREYDIEILAWIKDMEVLLVMALLSSGPSTNAPLQKKKKNTNGSGLENKPFGNDGSSTEEPIVCHLISDELISGGQEEKQGLKRRAPRPSRSEAQLHSWRLYRTSLVGTSLKASTAFALLQLGQIAPGHVVVDPMCGCGTIPLEAADWLRGRVGALAGDASSHAVNAAAANARAGLEAGGSPCDVMQWDAANLPLRNGIVDRVVCDMPFGNRCGNAREREWLCPRVLEEVVRILCPGSGIAVLMAQSKTMRREVDVNQNGYLESLQHLPIDMEGLTVDVYVLRRTTKQFEMSGAFKRKNRVFKS